MAWLPAPWPQNPEVDEDVRWDPPPRIIRLKERSVRLRSNMGYLSLYHLSLSPTRATQILRRPYAREETTRPRDHLLPPEDPTKDVTPTAATSAVHRYKPRRADLAQEDPLVQPDNARPRNTLH